MNGFCMLGINFLGSYAPQKQNRQICFSSNPQMTKTSPSGDVLELSSKDAVSPLKGSLADAMDFLKDLKFDEDDVKYVQDFGVVLPFKNGADAVNFIKDSNIKVEYGPMSSPKAHAQYDNDQNKIIINERYRNTQKPSEILAIAGAILHEAGHAKDHDGDSSVQEEIGCLGMNALAQRAFVKKFPGAFSDDNSLIVKDGVGIYAKLFFDKDPQKTALVNRLKDRYGILPAGDEKHPPGDLAMRVKA